MDNKSSYLEFIEKYTPKFTRGETIGRLIMVSSITGTITGRTVKELLEKGIDNCIDLGDNTIQYLNFIEKYQPTFKKDNVSDKLEMYIPIFADIEFKADTAEELLQIGINEVNEVNECKNDFDIFDIFN